MFPVLQRHTRIAFWNLCIVALIGFTLRYKIAYSFPFLDQKHLLQGHSHFAFVGWITHALMISLVHYLVNQGGQLLLKKYTWLLNANLITAYGMLISFPIQGYGWLSISFSTASIFVFYIFAVRLWIDLNRLANKTVVHWWIKAAVLFGAVSSIGTFALAWMMVTKVVNQNASLAAVYFFLHFQYNGWFFFAIMALAFHRFLPHTSMSVQKRIFWLFAAACIPAYVLSALWLPLPGWTYILVVASAVAQVIAWWICIRAIRSQLPFIRSSIAPFNWIFLLVCIALSIKLLLQLGSTIPSLSQLAFGFRPIVIGYLHLILLGVITLFLLGYLVSQRFINYGKRTITAIKIFTAGVILNELFLMIQGVSAMYYFSVPYINESLLAAALTMLAGILLLNFSSNSDK